MAETVSPFVGVWSLDPMTGEYGPGLPVPSAAMLSVQPRDGGWWIHARWTIGGETRQASTAPGDGEPPDLRPVDGDDDALRWVQRLRGPDGWTTAEAVYRRTAVKQVLLYRRDLKMRKGKIAAQCAHAALAVFLRSRTGPSHQLVVPLDGPTAAWVAGGSTKVCLSVEDEDALLAAHRAARAARLPCALITDAGRTEFGGVPTRTAVAIGPAAIPEIDRITGPDGAVACKLA